ncbi:MAG: DUF2318 domain-containing protein [Desulfuromonadales bacterium]|nr:DUF2318 domain-containing protein [Desulfuromonadales bacterium]
MEFVTSKRALWVAVVLTALLVGVACVGAFELPGLGKYQRVKLVNGVVSIPLAKVSDGKAHFYKLTDSGKEVGFFVVKGADGAIHTAFDSCDVCFKEKKGYTQQGDFMVCKNCNQRFATNRIGPHAAGGCNPSYLASGTEGESIVIKAADLKAGCKYF